MGIPSRLYPTAQPRFVRMVLQRSPRQVDGCDDRARLAAQQDGIASFAGKIGSGAHRDSGIGLGERSRVVDAVADHGYFATRGLQSANVRQLLFGKQSGVELVDAGLLRDRFGRGGGVSGEHDGSQAALLQRCERLGGSGADLVLRDEMAAILAVDGDEQDAAVSTLNSRAG